MARDSKSAWMGEALPIRYENVGTGREPLPGLEQRRRFPKREKAGNIGKLRDGANPYPLLQGEVGPFKYHNSGKNRCIRRGMGSKRDVTAGHQLNLLDFQRFHTDFFGQLFLQLDSLLRR